MTSIEHETVMDSYNDRRFGQETERNFITVNPRAASAASTSGLAQVAQLVVPLQGPQARASPSSAKAYDNTCTPRSISDSLSERLSPRDPNTEIQIQNIQARVSRRPSPRLFEKLQQLRTRKATSFSAASEQAPGRIPETKIRLLDSLHKADETVVRRRGLSWAASGAPVLELGFHVDTDARTLPPLPPMASLTHGADDTSSMASVSGRLLPSVFAREQTHTDEDKYRLPESGKANASSRNGLLGGETSVADRERPPTPPPKDTLGTPLTNGNSDRAGGLSPTKGGAEFDNCADFSPGNLTRTASIYTLSRASFSNQLSQLTTIRLPQASTLAQSISSIPTSAGATQALNEASEQIKKWIAKIMEVLEGMSADDDIEWAAAGGRDGLEEVDTAIDRFEGLINVYVSGVEQLENRSDIGKLDSADLEEVVDRMVKIVNSWQQIKTTLQGVKEQVELAMEWEELWNTVLGEIGQEVDGLNRLIFEMEERRHRGILDAMAEPGRVLDMNELATVIEEAPSKSTGAANKPQRGDSTPLQTSNRQPNDDDRNLVGLYARMQPLRASLDFFPMRLGAFTQRAREAFPTGCEELEKRLESLEAKYRKIEADAESLRKELGEDRWVIIFRKASEKALKMCESVDRSIIKLRDALEDGMQHTNPPALVKRLENYEAKKDHYGPAIQQVLSIIHRGVQTRLTVNGEILRLQADMRRRWMELEASIKGMDFAIEQLQVGKIQHNLRDSISTILSEQRSVSSSVMDTPGSSPASSIVLVSRQSSDQSTTTPHAKSRQSNFAHSAGARSASSNRLSNMTTPMNSAGKSLARSSVADLRSGGSARLYTTPISARSISRAGSNAESRADPSRPDPNKPRWNGSTIVPDTPIVPAFKPLSETTPSPYRKTPSGLPTPRSVSSGQYGLASPLGARMAQPKSGLRPPSALSRRPPSALAHNRNVSTGSSTLPKLAPRQATSGLPTSGLPTSRRAPAAVGHISTGSVSSVKGTAQKVQPLSYKSTPMTPISTNYAQTMSSRPATAKNLPQKTPNNKAVLGAGDLLDGEGPTSPTSKLPRPNTSMAGHRASMLPQPRRIGGPSDTPSAMNGRTSVLGGRTSRAGTALGRRSSMAFNLKSGTDASRPVWKG